MRVLIVCKYKEALLHNMAPFIWEQVHALSGQGVSVHFFKVKGKGIKGYLKEFLDLMKAINDFHPDIIHAHYGLCGLLANLQRSVPVVTTYHGSDINDPKVRRLSKMTIRLSAFNIFVSKKQLELVNPGKKHDVIPCGINLEDYPIVDKLETRREMGLDPDRKYVLFAGAFDNTVKNYPLAKAAVDMIPEAELLELKGYSRDQVALLMNAVDCFLMTSHTEGSPQVIKEAMACGCPIVSVDVGDVCNVICETEGCFIADRNAIDIAEKIRKSLNFGRRTDGRERILRLGLSNDAIAKKLMNVVFMKIQ